MKRPDVGPLSPIAATFLYSSSALCLVCLASLRRVSMATFQKFYQASAAHRFVGIRVLIGLGSGMLCCKVMGLLLHPRTVFLGEAT